MPSHAFLGAGASHSCHLAEDAYSAVARARARRNCVAHDLSPDSAQGGIPADKGWNRTPSRLACAPCMGHPSERSDSPHFIATPSLPRCLHCVPSPLPHEGNEAALPYLTLFALRRKLRHLSRSWTRFRVQEDCRQLETPDRAAFGKCIIANALTEDGK